MPGARPAPMTPCADKKHTSVVATGVPPHAGIPCAMVLTAYSALSLVTGLCCHHHQRDAARDITSVRCKASSLVMRGRLRQFDASVGASGPHGFAVRCQRASSCAPSRPPHPIPNVRDDREAPLLQRARNGTVIVVILARREAKCFCAGHWTRQLQNSPSGKSAGRALGDDGTRLHPAG
jgi:hypothetical protein